MEKTTHPKANWYDPDIVDTQLDTPKYYTSNPLITEFIGQWKKKIWEIMNHCDPKVQKAQLETMVQCLEEMGQNVKDFLVKWQKAQKETEE